MKKKAEKRSSPKKRTVTLNQKKFRKGAAKDGALYVVAILAIIATFGAMVSGGVLPDVLTSKFPQKQPNPFTCCDSGDGAACHPLTGPGQTITYNGDIYGLLKSNINIGEVEHDAPANAITPDGHPIFINTSDQFDAAKQHGSILPGSNCSPGKDYIGLNDPAKYGAAEPYYGGYFCIPNDEIIYVCKGSIQDCSKQTNVGNLPFDAYYRIKDGPVPEQISNECPKPSGSYTGTSQQIVGVPTPGGRKNLQLETFQVKQQEQTYKWLGAWCKPAINLYTRGKMSVHVSVNPQGKFTYTSPLYPQGGWDITAYPDGKIIYNNTYYPYLYWEATIPNTLIHQPDTGYVISYSDLGNFFRTLLPQTGLNERETGQFTDYWLKALPQSPYYFVGLMPQTEINHLAPLTISPRPDNLLRVTLYFKALDQKTQVTPPQQFLPFIRSGFTVTEWGGFFQADKNHPGFTCLM